MWSKKKDVGMGLLEYSLCSTWLAYMLPFLYLKLNLVFGAVIPTFFSIIDLHVFLCVVLSNQYTTGACCSFELLLDCSK